MTGLKMFSTDVLAQASGLKNLVSRDHLTQVSGVKKLVSNGVLTQVTGLRKLVWSQVRWHLLIVCAESWQLMPMNLRARHPIYNHTLQCSYTCVSFKMLNTQWVFSNKKNLFIPLSCQHMLKIQYGSSI